MSFSAASIKCLGEIILGKRDTCTYRKGSDLVAFFNDFFDAKDKYENFPARVEYVKQKLDALNHSDKILLVTEEALITMHLQDPVHTREALSQLEKYLAKDGYKISIKHNENHLSDNYTKIKVTSIEETFVDFNNKLINQDYVDEQIRKSKEKIATGDLDGAITNARSLVEAMLEFILKSRGEIAPEHNGDLLILYKRVKKILHLDPSQEDLEETLKQILRGLIGIVTGLAGLSNKMSDRHNRRYKPQPYHARLAVNGAFTLCDFVLHAHIAKLQK